MVMPKKMISLREDQVKFIQEVRGLYGLSLAGFIRYAIDREIAAHKHILPEGGFSGKEKAFILALRELL